MNSLHEKLWDAFSDISFEEKRHKYTDSLGTYYQSATGWIHKFSPDKDWDAIRARAAVKAIKKEKGKDYTPSDEEITAKSEALKIEWDRAGDYACNLGTQVHSVMENLWNKKDYQFDDNLDAKFPEMREDFNYRKTRCQELFKKMKQIYVPIANEFIVYDQTNGLCGTIDFLAYNKVTKTYSIIDWKTSKKLEDKNIFGEYLKDPFGDIESCNTSEYSLQLSLYKYILTKKVDIPINELLLFQLPGKDVLVPQVHRCMDLSDRISKILKP